MSFSNNPKLGNIEIVAYFDIPRKKDAEGNLRTDIFIFQLKHNGDFDKIVAGEILELS